MEVTHDSSEKSHDIMDDVCLPDDKRAKVKEIGKVEDIAVEEICEPVKNSELSEIENLIKSDQPEKALASAKLFLDAKPDNVECLILTGKICMQLGRFEESLKFYQTALKHEPNNKIIVSDLKLLQKCISKDYESRGGEKNCNTLDFCTMDPYPGDDELMALEKEILVTNYLRKIPTVVIPNLPKTPQSAAKYAMLSQQCKVVGDYDGAILEISKSIQIDGNNSSWRVLRAQLFFLRDNLPCTINDLIAVPKKNRDEEIWKMGGMVFQQLQLPVLAELWFKCAAKVSGTNDVEAAILFQQVRVKRLYDPLIAKDCPIKVDFTKYGRAITATSKINSGDIIFNDAPIVSSRTASTWKSRSCGNCGRSLMTAEDYFGNEIQSLSDIHLELIAKHWPVKTDVPCECERETYCSDDCRVAAWNSYHSIICPVKTAAAVGLYDLCDNDGKVYDETKQDWEQIWTPIYSPMVLAKIWAAVVCSVKRYMEEDGVEAPTVLHWAKGKAPYRRFIAFGAEQFKPKMPTVIALFNTIFTTCHDTIKYRITEEEFQGRFSQASCNLQAHSAGLSPYKLFLSRLTDEPDAFTLLPHLTRKPRDILLTGLFPLHACLNHSCLNNVEVVDCDSDGIPGVAVRARRDIVPGEELLTTYIDTTTPKKLRRAWLYRSFNFWCECPRCKFEGEDSEVCANCGVESKDGKQFPACGKCRKAWYCGVGCQKLAWRAGHKDVCGAGHSDTCYTDE